MLKIKNGVLDQYGAEPFDLFEQHQFGRAGVVKGLMLKSKTNPSIDIDSSEWYFNSAKPASLHPLMDSRATISLVMLQTNPDVIVNLTKT